VQTFPHTLVFIGLLSILTACGGQAVRAEPSATITPPQSLAPQILAPLQDQHFGEGDCGCELRLLGSGHQPKVFAVNFMHSETQARLNLHGKDVLADRQDSNPTPQSKLGAKYTQLWLTSGVRIRVDYTVVENCDDDVAIGDCEGRGLTARITAESGAHTHTLETQGYCGC